MGCVGLTLNILSAALLHEHHGHHPHGDLAHHSHAATEFPPPGEIGSSSTEDFETLTPISAHADHRHTVAKFQSSSSDQDLGMLGVLTHVLSDALNNIGVIIAALVVWLTHYDARFYADPGVSMGIAVMILLSSFPLVKNSGKILMESAPHGVDLGDVKHDLETACLHLSSVVSLARVIY